MTFWTFARISNEIRLGGENVYLFVWRELDIKYTYENSLEFVLHDNSRQLVLPYEESLPLLILWDTFVTTETSNIKNSK